MKSLIGRIGLTAAALAATTLPALAQSQFYHNRRNTVSVPEIDASTSMMALAAVCAVLLFVWDRRRRNA